MPRRVLHTFLLALVCCGLQQGCNTVSSQTGDSVNSNSTTGDDPGNSNDNTNTNGNGNDNSPGGGTNPDDPTNPLDDPEPTAPVPDNAVIRARVRNESSLRADVTLRFIREDAVVHLAFIRVLPDTVTTLVSPEPADLIELSGVDAEGGALPSVSLRFGIDYDEQTVAEYLIVDGAIDLPPDEPDAPLATPPVVTMVEPSGDVVATLGTTVVVSWTDDASTPNAVVRIFLRAAGGGSNAELVPVSPAIGAALDGLNDRFSIVLQDIAPGTYAVVAEIDDGITQATSVASGMISVEPSPVNVAPSLVVSEPDEDVELRAGDLLFVAWTDDDPDDNATIRFSLVPSNPGDASLGEFPIGPPIAEDPDDSGADAAWLAVLDALPGLYDLIGRIDDGDLVGTAQAAGTVRVLPDPQNDPPQITLIQPAGDIAVDISGSFLVQWIDSDENDNARISLLLDPDLTGLALDGDEILLVSSLAEDLDEEGDQITIGFPSGIATGLYQLLGVITDGSVEVVARAPGLVSVEPIGQSGDGDPPTISFVSPAGDVFARVGDSVAVQLRTSNVPLSVRPRFFLSNVSLGGNILAEVTLDVLSLHDAGSIVLPDDSTLIPNKAWPREFELSVEVTVDDATYTAVAPGHVWIRQEVEIVRASMVNYYCSVEELALKDDSGTANVELEWFGGGFGGGHDVLQTVAFWVSADGDVPSTEDDEIHRLFLEEAESPNLVRVELVAFSAVFGQSIGGTPGVEVREGVYHVISVVSPPAFGRIQSAPHPDPVEACSPLKVPSGSGSG